MNFFFFFTKVEAAEEWSDTAEDESKVGTTPLVRGVDGQGLQDAGLPIFTGDIDLGKGGGGGGGVGVGDEVDLLVLSL